MMKANIEHFAVRASVVAVQGALCALAVMPIAYADETIAELSTPINTVEIGITNVDKGSYKFGEYSGLEKKGAYLQGGFELNGGGGAESALRYRVTGKELGLDTRNLGAEFGEQGKFRFKFGYDESVKNRSDSFMTPYNGTGSDTLTLPANWATNARNCTVSSWAGAVTAANAGCGNYYVSQNRTAGNRTATPTGNMGALTAAEQADFHHENLATQRKKGSVGLDFVIDNQWQISGSAIHETKDGAQAIGQPIGSATSSQVTLPNPIKYSTNQFELKLNYKGDKGFAQAGYYASIFQNSISSVTYQDPFFSSATPAITSGGLTNYPFPDNGRFASAPENQFHQFSLTGGYNFSKTTKLVVDASYGRNTQDQAFQPYGTAYWQNVPLPATSLHGLVLTKAFDLKLTAKPVKDLRLAAAYKYNERDNQTPSTTGWKFTEGDLQTPFTAGTLPTVAQMNVAGGVSANRPSGTAVITTSPYSKKTNQLNLDADYGFAKGQAVKLGYEYQKVNRNCETTTYDCANVKDQKENTVRVEYRNNLMENVTGRIGFVVSDRTGSTYTNSPYLGAGLASDTITRWLFTDRKRDKLRSSVNWQATDALDLTLSYDYTKDRYDLGKNPGGTPPYQPIGLSDAKTDAVNLDVNFTVSEKLSFNGFYSEEHTSSLLIANINPANVAAASSPAWRADMKDKTETFGFGFKALPSGGKLELAGDYVKVHATSPYALSGGGGAVSTNAAYTGIASTFFDFPSVYSNSDTLNLTAKYKVSKSSAWRFAYGYQKLSSADPLTYNGLQIGSVNNAVAGSGTAAVNGVAVPAGSVVPISSLTPTNESAPNYSVQVIGVTYIYTFH